ncbi:DgyrCDS7412 [Dimorphilus gyrociliatus]|uniref:DgyrCDS7412 n=1 Tax=Dimorphilus gyrociliatus TaxID=2664684 RepID=A0A7I8VVX8_9ANNE|nr:DgyrCDS7412 [Dimorphilus gyrociliatus]
MDNLSPTSSDFEFAKRLQQEENRMILNLEEDCHTDSTSSEEAIYVVENSGKSEEKYGLNLLENHITDDEDDVLEAARPNTLNDSLLAEQLQAHFNTSGTGESDSLESAVRLQNEFERESRTLRENVQTATSAPSVDNGQSASRVRQRFRQLLNPVRRGFPIRRSNASSLARHRIPESLDGLLHGLSRVISMQHFNDFSTDPVGYLESSQIGSMFTGNNFSGNDYESLWEIAEQLGEAKHRGLNKETLNTLPTSTFSNEKEETNTIRGSSCVVCLETYEAGDKLKTLPCLHQYHHECIDKWLEVI